ncbi:MAG TPA: DUF4340 domain-containing protein [Vicinamibacterales bacterium]|nr:DUF4340 domain-containing protein [Vicinamibacterales bacterium]
MRGLRSFLGLFAILVALGAYLYFVESKRTPGAPAEKRDKVFAVEADQIEELTIRSESGDRTTLRRAGGAWQIVEPLTAEADETEAAGIARGLSTLEQERIIEEEPSSLEEFGLAEPRIEIAFKAAGTEHRLLIGSKTPTGGDLYAKTDDSPRVFLVASWHESTFDRGTFELRDKTALKFDRDAADSLEIVTGGRTIRFAKANGEWQIAQPPVSRPDAPAIEGLLARLRNLQMKKVVTPEQAAKHGLDSPAATVHIGSGSSRATLLVGAEAGEGEVYARDAARPAIFTIEASLLDDLKRDAAEYRQKDIFDARVFNTTRVEVARAGQTLVFEKTDGTWRQTAPEAKEADGSKIDALLSALTIARAESFVERQPQGAATEASVALKFDDGRKEERVTFFRSGGDAYAVRSDAQGAARIEASVLDGILKALDEVR